MTQTPEPWIWLQVEEATGKADACTCRLDAAGPDGDDSGAAFYMCPLHVAAPNLLAALEALLVTEDEANGTCLWCGDVKWLRHPNGGPCVVNDCPGVMARAAIAKAKGI